MMPKMNVGANIKRIRLERENSRERLSRKIGISAMQVYRLETNEQGCRDEVIFKLAKALDTPPFRFFMTEKEWNDWRKICPDGS
jgi:transcriptional regulator with XRE-family HTH domain